MSFPTVGRIEYSLSLLINHDLLDLNKGEDGSVDLAVTKGVPDLIDLTVTRVNACTF